MSHANSPRVDRLIIYSEYRGYGFGIFAMRALILALRAGTGLVVIKPFPLQFEAGSELVDSKSDRLQLGAFTKNERKATARLRRLYATLGFKPIPKTPYMVRDAQMKLPIIETFRTEHQAAPPARSP